MRFLFVGDASNLHNTLARALRQQGHEAVVVSGGSAWMDTDRDITLRRTSGKWGGVCYLARLVSLLPKFRSYDVVEIAGQVFLGLRPEKIMRVFNYLKRHNRHIVLSALGTDYNYYRACHDGHTFRYSDYMIGDMPSPYVGSGEYHAQHQENWDKPPMRALSRLITNGVDGVAACLWEYYVTYRPLVERTIHAGIPIDTDSLTMRPLATEPAKVKFFLGIQRDRMAIKGTDRLLEAVQRLRDRFPRQCELTVVENVPFKDYVRLMRDSHVILDQLYSYTPATNALLGMAQGLVAVSGAEPEYYELIEERDNRPIINVSPLIEGDIDARLEWLIAHKSQLPALATASRQFVVKHNAAPLVARKHIELVASLQGNGL